MFGVSEPLCPDPIHQTVSHFLEKSVTEHRGPRAFHSSLDGLAWKTNYGFPAKTRPNDLNESYKGGPWLLCNLLFGVIVRKVAIIMLL